MLAFVVEGTPRIETFEVLSSTLHKTFASLPIAERTQTVPPVPATVG
jgi:hypothetical protein